MGRWKEGPQKVQITRRSHWKSRSQSDGVMPFLKILKYQIISLKDAVVSRWNFFKEKISPPPGKWWGKWPSSGKMTLNAPWIEQLTLRSQVIRETKGQAKQEEDPLPCPLPPSQTRRPNVPWLRPTFSSRFSPRCMVVKNGVGEACNLERNEASEMNQGWKN